MSQKYSKDSFDRFGDDLCSVLLSYLPVDHKLRFECLSTQWQRLVFSRQTHLEIDLKILNNIKPFKNKSLNLSGFEALLKKCEYITAIEFTNTDGYIKLIQSVFELIIIYCDH